MRLDLSDAAHAIKEADRHINELLLPFMPANAEHLKDYAQLCKVEYICAMLLIERGHSIKWVKRYLKRNHDIIIDHKFLDDVYGFKNGEGDGDVKKAIKREFDRMSEIELKPEPYYED